MSDKQFRERVSMLLDDLEYDLSSKFDCKDESPAYQLGVYTVMVSYAKDTIQNFRKREGIKRETSNDFDSNPMTII